MTAPRAREQRRPPSPPDRRPPRRGGGSTPYPYAASAAGRAAGPARPAGARRGLVRSARALAAAALLALSGALALPPSAQAQTVTTLVSNIGQGVTGQTNVSDRSISQRFDTGDNGNGYTLTGVDLVSESSDAFAAQVCETDSSGHPTSTCWALEAPGTFVEGTVSFAAPAGTTLAKETTYAVVVTRSGSGGDVGFTNSDSENPGKAAEWGIADVYERLNIDLDAYVSHSGGNALQIAIKGTITPTPPTVSVGDAAATEGNAVVFPVTLSAAAAENVVVNWRATIESGDTAVLADLGEPRAGAVTIPSGSTTGGTFRVPTAQDTADEPNETFTVTLLSVTSAAQLAADPTAKGTINDDDLPTLSVGDAAATEGNPVIFAATLSQVATELVTATWTASIESGDTATTGDLGSTTTGLVTIGLGEIRHAFEVPTAQDTTVEGNETFTVTLSGVSSNATLGTATAKGTINDDDGTVWSTTMTVAEIQAGEHGYSSSAMKGELGDDDFEYGSPAVTYTVDVLTVGTRAVSFIVDSAGLPESDTLTLELAGHEFPFSARRSFSDTTNWFWESPDELDHPATEFPVGTTATVCLRTEAQTCPSGDIMTPLSTDATLRGLSLALGTGVVRPGATLSPTFASATTTYTASVANSFDEVTVRPTTNHASADFEIQDADGNALADADTNAADHQVALAVGQTVIKVEVTAEDGTSTQTYTVTVTRAAETPTLSVADAAAVTEGSPATFTVMLAPASAEQVTVTWFAVEVPGNTASVEVDFTSGDPQTLTFAPGDTTKTVSVPTIDDALDEEDAETFTLTLRLATNASFVGGASEFETTGTIVDNDELPTLSVADVSAEEGNSLTFTVTLSAESGREVTVAWAAATLDAEGDDAEEGTDYAVGSGTLTFTPHSATYSEEEEEVIVTPGQTEKTFTVATTDDTAEEMAETFTVTLSGPTNAGISDATAKGTITDNDGTLPRLSVADAAASEGDNVTFTVTLSATSTEAVTVDWATSVESGDNATTGTDFTAASSTLTFMAGDERKMFTVMTTEDTASEANETFTVTLSGVSATATLGTATATGTIDNDDAPAAPTNFAAAVGDTQVTLSWAAPDSGSGVTRHEHRRKEGTGGYPANFTPIPDSGEGGTNQFTVTGLTNETAYTFELRAVAGTVNGTAAEAGPVTPTPGICGRTAKIQEVILAELADVSECAAVTVANLASITTFGGINGFGTLGQGITSLKAGDFAGLTALTILELGRNQLASLPDGIFSGLTAVTGIYVNENQLTALPEGTFAELSNLTTITMSGNDITQIPAGLFTGLTSLAEVDLSTNELTAIPAGLFTGLTSLEEILLSGNKLSSLDAGVFSGLTALDDLGLGSNDLSSLPAGLFTGLAALEGLNLSDNDLTRTGLPAGLFSDLTALQRLRLNDNDLTSLPAGLLSGLTGLTRLALFGNTVDPLPLTVTVEKVGTDQARAEVLAGAPLAVNFKATVANGALAGGASTTLGVAAGSVEGTPVTVERTAGAMAAVTVDIDLTTQPTLPTNHQGYEFVKATSGLPATILPDTRGPQNFIAKPGDGQAVLSWDAPASGSGVTRHDYRYKSGTGSYPTMWTQIPNSAEDGANEDGYTVPNLTNETVYTFELRSVVGTTEGAASESNAVTPTPGICDRTPKIQEVILAELAGVSECAAVTVANLASITTFGGINSLGTFLQGIASLQAGDFGGLTGLTILNLSQNQLTSLPEGIFSGLTAVRQISLETNQLTALPEGTFAGLPNLILIELTSNSLTAIPARAFAGLTGLEEINLGANDLTALPAGLFTGLRALRTLYLSFNKLSSLPGTVFSGLAALESLNLQNNDLSSLPAGLFSGLTSLDSLKLYENDLTSLPAGLFSSLTALNTLELNDNDLTALPDGLFSGLSALSALNLGDNPNAGDTLALTVTVEKFGTDQARAKVLAGAPFAVGFTPTVANGALAGGASTTLGVAAGSVEGTPVTVTRTTGTMAAVTVDIDLSTQPTRPSGFTGFTFAKAATGLPAEILPDTRGPQNFTAKPGDGQAVLSWTAPASGSGVTKHQYRYKSGTGSYPANWTAIPNSAEDGANEDGFTVPNLTNETVYTFELRSVVGTTEGAASESNAVTPTPGICDRTQQVQDGILAALADVTECEAVTVANLAGIGDLYVINTGITSVQLGDFAGLTGLQELSLKENSSLTALPSGVFSGLTALAILDLSDNALATLPAGVFSGLAALVELYLSGNELTALPAGLFSGLTRLFNLELHGNPVDPLPLTVTVEKVGTDRVRAKVLAGAPFNVNIPVTPANGTLAGDVTALRVAKGSVESAAVTVTRTDGTTAAVTVDVDLTTQPSLPTGHGGYEFAKAPSGLPAEILPEEASLEPPTGFRAREGDRQAVLAWTPPAPDSGFTRHQYRYRTDGSWEPWTDISDSGPGEANATRYTVTGLANAVEYTFELRARDAGAGKSDAATVKVTPTGPPRIVGVAVTSGPGLDGDTYGVGEEIRVSVTFDQPVAVTGDPELALDVGGPRLAEYDSGGDSETLVFVYVVTEDDRDADGVSIGDDAIRLDGDDGIGNGAGDEAELAHDAPGAQPGHRVDGARRAGVHTHEAFTHGHSVFNNGKRFYTQEYPSHTHEGHEHPDKANGHRRRPGTHIHHAPEDPNAFVSGGPGVRKHDGVDHMHRCFDVNPRCNKGDAFTSGTPGLPIEVTHDHENSEPGHGYDWRGEYFEAAPPAPTGVTATPGAGQARLSWEAPALEWDPKALAWVVPAPGLPAHVTHHEYRWTTDGDDVGWTAIPDSALFGRNRAGFTVTGLADGKTYTFELRAANAGGGGPPVQAENVTTATVPEIEGVEVASTPDRNDTYGAGDGIRIEVTFDQAVEVEGDPEFGLSVGGERVAMYRWGSGTEVLVFVYTVRPEDRDRDGIWIGAHDHAENPTFRLDGDDRIRNAAGQDADLSHDAPGRLRDHKVNGGGESPGRDEHSHQEFTHSHGHSRGAFAQVFARHGHAYHVHDDTDGGHSSAMRPGQHVHHVQENLSGDFGPDLRGHGGVEHTHWCGDIEPDCNPDRETVQVADELGLPVRVTHAHTDSEPGHRFGWRGYFGEAGSDPLLSVMGAEATEGDDGALDFTVRLDREPRSEVTVRYATEDGDATAGSDYTATRGTLRFGPGETAKTVRVPILDDTVQDDGETLTLALSNASGAGIWSQAATATGTIHNREEREGPAPLTARFEDLPPGHDGESVFRFRVAFSADIGISYRSLREDAFEVAGGPGDARPRAWTTGAISSR